MIEESATHSSNKEKILSLVDPKLRYLSNPQAVEWIKICESKNVHASNDEVSILYKLVPSVLKRAESVDIIDLGCGDGNKAAQLIKLLLKKKLFTINKYIAVDINPLLLEVAVKRVTRTNPSFPEEKCRKARITFEKLRKKNFNSSNNRIFLFLGNTFNNFEVESIMKTMERFTSQGDILALGVKCRKNNSKGEFARMIKQYQSYGDDFTFTMGRELGIPSDFMTREVIYNQELNRIEVWIKLKTETHIFSKNIRRLHVLNSYKPQISELISKLQKKFSILTVGTKNDNVVILLTKTSVLKR